MAYGQIGIVKSFTLGRLGEKDQVQIKESCNLTIIRPKEDTFIVLNGNHNQTPQLTKGTCAFPIHSSNLLIVDLARSKWVDKFGMFPC